MTSREKTVWWWSAKITGYAVLVFGLAGWPDDWDIWRTVWIPALQDFVSQHWRMVLIVLGGLVTFMPSAAWRWLGSIFRPRKKHRRENLSADVMGLEALLDVVREFMAEHKKAIRSSDDEGERQMVEAACFVRFPAFLRSAFGSTEYKKYLDAVEPARGGTSILIAETAVGYLMGLTCRKMMNADSAMSNLTAQIKSLEEATVTDRMELDSLRTAIEKI